MFGGRAGKGDDLVEASSKLGWKGFLLDHATHFMKQCTSSTPGLYSVAFWTGPLCPCRKWIRFMHISRNPKTVSSR